MNIKDVYSVTTHYITKKGHDFTIIGIELTDIPEDMKDSYQPTMYGSINRKYVTDGKLNRVLTLASMAIGKTVADAIQHREDMEEIEGMSMDELVAHFKAKAAIAE